MADEEKEELFEEIPSDFGFFRNLHLKPFDIELKVKLLESLFQNSTYYYTMRSILKLLGGIVIPNLLIIIFCTHNANQISYILMPLLLIDVGVMILVCQWSLVSRTGGTLLQNSFALFKEWRTELLEKRGRRRRFRALGIKGVDRRGRIEFANGNYGYLYEVDGNISRTSYPSEIVAQNAISREYQNTRNHTTYEVKITSSRRQTVEDQVQNMEMRVKRFKDKGADALVDLCQMQSDILAYNVEGRMLTIEQHLMIVDPSEIKLEEYVNRLNAFVNGARGQSKLYKNARRLSQTEAIDFLSKIHSLK